MYRFEAPVQLRGCLCRGYVNGNNGAKYPVRGKNSILGTLILADKYSRIKMHKFVHIIMEKICILSTMTGYRTAEGGILVEIYQDREQDGQPG